MLIGVASACRDRRLLGFAYRDHSGRASERLVEPLRLVNAGRRWYLLAWDRDRADWRTFRAERIAPPLRLGAAVALRLPPQEPAAMVDAAIRYSPQAMGFALSVRLRGSAAELGARIPLWCGTLQDEADGHCRLSLLADAVPWLAAQLLTIGVPFAGLEATAEVRTALRGVLNALLEQVPEPAPVE